MTNSFGALVLTISRSDYGLNRSDEFQRNPVSVRRLKTRGGIVREYLLNGLSSPLLSRKQGLSG